MNDGIGRSPKRREDERFLRGQGAFLDDLSLPAMLHAVIVRSPHAHAHIRVIDVGSASAVPGFVRLIGPDDIGPVKPIPVRLGPSPAFEPHLQRPFAAGSARYVGEPVAMVLAETRRAAEDAADLVQVDFEPLQAQVDPRAAAAAGNVVASWSRGFGDIEAALREAYCVVRERFVASRQTAVPLEPRGLLAEFDAGRKLLTMWGPTKVPYFNRAVLSEMLGLSELNIHFIEPDVGGGFGARGEFYPEDFLVPFAARLCGRPVKWVETRREHFLSINHARGQEWEIAIAARRDGTLLGIDASVLHDQGAYIRTHGTIVPAVSVAHLPGPYLLPHYRCAVRCVTTNCTPTATMRGPGLFECNLVRERTLDLVAHQLGLDPREVRRRNLVPPERIPYEVGTDIMGMRTLYDSGDFVRMYDRTLEIAAASAMPVGVLDRLTGFGVAAVAEPSGWGPFESARVEVDPSGAIRVCTGATSQGQGHETTLAQVCGELLDVPIENITVVHGDTRLMRYGVGTYASRAAVTAGSAVFKATRIVRERALDLASEHLEVAREDLVLVDGRVQIAGVPDRSVTLGELARLAMPGARRGAVAETERAEEGLSALAYFQVHDETTGFSVHTAQVSIDPSTGQVAVDRYVVAADVGRAINPMIVEAQLIGGAVQGINGALHERLEYDESGQLLSATLMDYTLPNASDIVRVEALIFEDARVASNPLGIKGVGEAGTSGAGAAIANAVADALRPLGVKITEIPLTPERIWRALSAAKSR